MAEALAGQTPASISPCTAKLLRFSAGVLTAQDDSLSVNVARYCQSVIP